MAAVGIGVQLSKGAHNSCPERIQVNIPHQFSQVEFVARGIVAVLKRKWA
jgi:hypothetical protein